MRPTVERLPPVTSYWPGLPVFPAASAVESAAAPAASHPLAATVADASPQAAPPSEAGPLSEKEGDKPSDDAKTEPEVPDDPLPSMLESVVIERIPWYYLDTPSWLDSWKGSFEMGLDGSSGNSDTFNIRLGATAKRKTKQHSLSMNLDYHKNTNDAVETANRFNFDGRYEKLNEEHPWTWFFQQTTDYDEFQPWNVRVVASGGLGYRFFDDEITMLTVRLGGGFSQEIGGPDQDCVPEMNYGIEFERQMTKRQKVKYSAEYFPSVACYSEFRVVSKMSWEVLLDEERHLSLKVSATDRYNYPNPGGKLNDIDYATVLLWSF